MINKEVSRKNQEKIFFVALDYKHHKDIDFQERDENIIITENPIITLSKYIPNFYYLSNYIPNFYYFISVFHHKYYYIPQEEHIFKREQYINALIETLNSKAIFEKEKFLKFLDSLDIDRLILLTRFFQDLFNKVEDLKGKKIILNIYESDSDIDNLNIIVLFNPHDSIEYIDSVMTKIYSILSGQDKDNLLWFLSIGEYIE